MENKKMNLRKQFKEMIMKKSMFLILLGLIITLSACAGPKELSEQQNLLAGLTNEKLCALLVKEKTSQEDVKKLFGAPYLTKVNIGLNYRNGANANYEKQNSVC